MNDPASPPVGPLAGPAPDASDWTPAKKPFTGRRLLWWIIAFFVLVFAVNGVFVYVSLNSFPGLETDNPYRKGVTYDRTLDAARAQRALGWKVDLKWISSGPAQGHLVVALNDKSGGPVAGHQVTVTMFRPVVSGMDHRFALHEAESGHYGADIRLAAPGNWEVDLRVMRPDGRDYLLHERIDVP
jgi:nitrogen fixation protein FixH